MIVIKLRVIYGVCGICRDGAIYIIQRIGNGVFVFVADAITVVAVIRHPVASFIGCTSCKNGLPVNTKEKKHETIT